MNPSDPAPPPNPYAPPPSGPALNPYAPPSADLSTTGLASDDAERVRLELLKHEASIRSVGTLYYLSFWILLFGTTVAIITLVIEPSVLSASILLIYGALTFLIRYLAAGLRRLDPGVRVWVTVLTIPSLIAVPIGTLISAYILWLLHSEKGKRVMTPEYRQIVAQTPHLKYKTPPWLVAVAIALLALIAIFFILAWVGS